MEGNCRFSKQGPKTGASKKHPDPEPKIKLESEKNQAESAVEAVRKYHLRDRYLWKRLRMRTPPEKALRHRF